MNKKMIAIFVVVVMTSMSIATIAFAQKEEMKSICIGEGCIIPSYPPNSKYPEITLAQGIAVDKTDLETKPIVFLIVKYRGETNTYLFSDSNFYKMTEFNRIDDWETGTKIFQYKADSGDVMTVMIQHFDSYGYVSASANFKNYLITFEPIYKYGPRPLSETGIVKELPKYEQIAKKLTQKTGMDIEDILGGSATPIAEWTN